MLLLKFLNFLLGILACSAISRDTFLYRRNSTGLTNTVTWDPHSLFLQGQRVFILSAEIHPWRLPGNPDLWADIFQKVKANGFNTVSFYVNWAVHFPTPTTNNSQGDFQPGTYRDIQRFIDEAKKAGLWMVARPGPYINAETTGGGFPGWVGNVAGSLRTNNANYAQAWTPYMTAIAKIIAKNQISNGGPIILVQAENEFSASANNNPYMQAIIDLYRQNGIVIPIIHNDQHAGQAGNFSPDLPGTHVDIYCGDSYPQGANSWAQVQSIYYSAHKAVAPNNPLCLAEFGGGFLLGWGAVATRSGTGYEKYSNDLTDASFENIFYKENYAQTATILNIYMLFGGTNWGQTLEPTVYSSYDYGGGINENRVAGPKMNEMRLQGLFLRVSRDLLAANLLANGTNYTTSTLIHTAELRNPTTGAAFYFSRHDASTWVTALTTTQLKVTTSLGALTIPTTGSLTFNGRESKIIVTDYVFGASNTRILYSTAEIMTWTSIGGVDYIILYAPSGQTGETAIRFASTPVVTTTNAPNLSQKFWITIVPITSGGVSIVLILMDKATANKWNAPIISGSGNFGQFFSVGTNTSLPEIDPAFDDSSFVTADLTTTNYTNLPPLAGNRVLYSQQYGFYGGNLIFRGHFNATGQETAITTTVQYGFAGGYSAWFNGVFLGSSQGSPTVSMTTDTWKIPSGSLRTGKDNVFVIIQDHMGIVETSTNGGKEPRGIRGFAIVGGNSVFNLWKLQGNQARDLRDSGYLNEGGLYAERVGAHLPGFPDSSWASGSPLIGGGVAGAGVNFYRTTFNLNVPDGVDMPVRLSITPSAITSNFRVQIYLNGWQVGKYINNIGPQTLFVLPAGILRRKSVNTLALSIWSLDGTGASLAGLQLVSDGTFGTSLAITDYVSPDFTDQQHLRPVAQVIKPM
ncbi:glycosyl hydrolases family 35-domain-containing protein [Infundibulicybe gibba]|nr:glycosyl hydrolases family 35-domain-containing protein [Infundibulicybe gibba]